MNQITMSAMKSKQALTHLLRGHGMMQTLPALGQVQFQTVEGNVAMTTNRIDRQVTVFVNEDVAYDDDAMIVDVPIPQVKAMLDQKIAALRDQVLTITWDDDGPIKLTIGNRQIEKVNELEPLPVWDEVDTFPLGTITDERYRKVISSAATDGSRPVLAGVHVTSPDERIVLAAADGFRMGLYAEPTKARVATANLIIPATAFGGVPKGQPVSIHLPNDYKLERAWLVYACQGMTTIYGVRTIEGKFPDLQQIVPHHSPADIVTLKSDDVVAISDYANKYGGNGVVRIERTALVAKSDEYGDMSINGYDHTHQIPDELALNGEYLKWAVEGDDELGLRFGTVNQPVVSHQGPLTLVIMPMMIGAN